MNRPIEYCIKCGAPTGHAGAGEDSLFTHGGNVGPYCDDCYADIDDMESPGASQDEGE